MKKEYLDHLYLERGNQLKLIEECKEKRAQIQTCEADVERIEVRIAILSHMLHVIDNLILTYLTLHK